MALTPQGRYVTFSLSGSSSVLYLAGADVERITESLTRTEFTHAKQREVPEADGTQPQYATLIAGTPAQITYSDIPTSPRNLAPDDTDLDMIYQKLFITRYTFQGANSTSSDIAQAYAFASIHHVYLDRFEAYKTFSNQASISFTELLALQLINFSYLTTTGLSCIGTTFGTINNAFIRSFSAEPVKDINAGAKVIYNWRMVLDQISILPLNS